MYSFLKMGDPVGNILSMRPGSFSTIISPVGVCGHAGFGEFLSQSGTNLIAGVIVALLLSILVIRLKRAAERIKALTALQESQAAFNDVVSSQAAGIYRIRVKAETDPVVPFDQRFSYEYVSDHFCAMLGCSREESLKDPAKSLRYIHPEDYDGFIAANLHANIENTPFTWEGRWEIDGEVHWYHFESQPRKLENSDTLWTGFVRDITESKEAALTAQRSDAKYRALFEDAGDYLLVLSPPAENTPPIIIDANTAALSRHGYSREELIGQPIFFIDTPEAAAKNRNAVSQLSINGPPLLFESEHRCKDGSIFPVEVSARMIQVGTDLPIILATERDISERKKAEMALSQSEGRFRHLFSDVANIAVQGYGPDGTVRFWNRASTELYGYTEEEAVGNNLLDLIIPPEMRGAVREAVDYMFTSGEKVPADELLLMRKDGTLVPVYSNHTVLEVTGAGKELYCIDIDLTKRKKAEGRVEHLNRVLRTLRQVDMLILQEKEPGSFVEKTCDLLVESHGYKTAMIMILGQLWTPDLVASAGIEEKNSDAPLIPLRPCCKEAMQSDRALLLKAGSDSCAGCNGAHLHNSDVICMALRYNSSLYGCIKASTDPANNIDTEELELFESLVADIAYALHSMEQEYAMAQVRLEKDRLEAEMRQAQKMEAVGRLTGGIAHDFNNKLTVILCTAELLLAKAGRESPLYQDLLNIQQAGEQSAALTRQLLTFSRKQASKPQQIHLNQFISSELQLLSRLIGEEVTIEFFPAQDKTGISIDPSHLDQILANLAVNARDAISGNGTITIETSIVTLTEENRHGITLPAGRYVLLSMKDSGSGIDAETIKNIFDPFFTTKAEGKGTGLGLSTVYGIVKDCHGGIYVESAVGEGTTFQIYFPHNASEGLNPLQREEEKIPCGAETVLVVEDNDLLLDLIVTLLGEKGYQVLQAASPRDACHCCETFPAEIHLLLTDIILPEMSGQDLKREIETMRPGIRTIFMSGYTAEVISAHGVDEERANFLSKPFTLEALHQKVHHVLHETGG